MFVNCKLDGFLLSLSSSNSVVSNITIENCVNGASITDSNVSLISVENCTNGASIAGSNLNNATFRNNMFHMALDSNNNVVDSIFTDSLKGVIITGDNNFLESNLITNTSREAIDIYSNYTTIRNNIITDNFQAGVYIEGGNNVVENNDISRNGGGIGITGQFNTISGNTMLRNGKAILLQRGSNNVIKNNIMNENQEGVKVGFASSLNLIFNNLLNNFFNAVPGPENVWNTTLTMGVNIMGGPYLGGNYWPEFTCVDADDNGICDSAYYNDELPLARNSSILSASKDSFIRSKTPNKNEGGNTILNIQFNGTNRVLVAFDIAAPPVQTATLRLFVSNNSNNWGSGRPVEVYRLLEDWTEGNGNEDDRGTGPGVTWNCSTDNNITNNGTNCAVKWNGGNFVAAPTDSVLITNGLTDQYIEFDVTADVNAFINGTANYGWLIKKANEMENGRIEINSRENSYNQPQLLLTW